MTRRDVTVSDFGDDYKAKHSTNKLGRITPEHYEI
jgi:hypothetical protein